MRLNHGRVRNLPKAAQPINGRLEIQTQVSDAKGWAVPSQQMTPTPHNLLVNALEPVRAESALELHFLYS